MGPNERRYQGYNWIRVARFTPDLDGSKDLKKHFRAFEEHHVKETSYLISVIRDLAAKLDEATRCKHCDRESVKRCPIHDHLSPK
jgi:uncharacterized OsmC-like protein